MRPAWSVPPLARLLVAASLVATTCGCSDDASSQGRFATGGGGAGASGGGGVGGAGGAGGVGAQSSGGAGGLGGLRLDEVRQKSAHNAFQRDEALFDMLVYHRVRSLELDLHVGKGGQPSLPGDWYVYHESTDTFSRCNRLTDCARELMAFHDAVPSHQPVTVFLDLKDDFGAQHQPDDLDAALVAAFGGALYGPAELAGTCPGAGSLREVVTGACGWPRLADLEGRVLVGLTGGNGCDAASRLRVYADQAAAPAAFIAPYVESGCDLADYESRGDVVMLNLDPGQVDLASEVRQLGLLSRVWGLNDAGAFGAAFNQRAHYLGTDKVNYEQDPWASTHTSTGFPFTCFDGCDPTLREADDLIGVELSSGDIWDGADSMYLVHSTYPNEVATWGGFVSTENSHTEDFAKGCLMARASTDAASPYFAVCRPADDNRIRVQVRAQAGGSTSAFDVAIVPSGTGEDESAPFVKLALTPSGNGTTATGYASLDGKTFTTIHSATFSAPLGVQGIAASAHGSATPIRFLFGGLVRAVGATSTAMTPATLGAGLAVGDCEAGQVFSGPLP